MVKGVRIHVSGVVQGVGFRPFVYSLAHRLHLTGWVRNTSAGVDIELNGPGASLESFSDLLLQEAPPLAHIDDIKVSSIEPDGYSEFQIIHSESIAGAYQPISADVCICNDCLQEMRDPGDRRYRYPFINCTNCGPRFTIVEDIPYDRPLTTMAPFEMCEQCAAEYQNPLDRRFHAQPIACPACGPHVWLVENTLAEDKSPGASAGLNREGDASHPSGDGAVQGARRALVAGMIVAVKGLGGFHLACDATNPVAVRTLRERKLRVDKPFAVMMPDIETIRENCQVNDSEEWLLLSRERPIVVLERLASSMIVQEIAPGQDTIGVLLPYTPLHYLLLEKAPGFPTVLVMTSGNLSEEPIATGNEEALRRLSSLADVYLLHNRAIRTRCDDSVIRVFPALKPSGMRYARDTKVDPKDDHQHEIVEPLVSGNAGSGLSPRIFPLRRSRGYAPCPIRLPWNGPALLATGGELKNVFCLTKDHDAFMSHHIGDMENYETLLAFEDGVSHYERLFRIAPEALVCDLHPDYLASRYAQERSAAAGLPLITVQHHFAHVVSCMVEHGLETGRPVIGLSFDGTGYGDDGAIWGGEVFTASYQEYQRIAHLAYVPLPGGDMAIKKPWRMALSWLDHSGLEWSDDLAPVRFLISIGDGSAVLDALKSQIKSGLNAPPTSSIGRLFDAIAALVGVRQEVNYEAQAAIELEAMADPAIEDAYPMDLSENLIDARPLIRAAVRDFRQGVPPSTISSRFHNGLARAALEICLQVRRERGLHQVIMSGGVWQNMTLLRKTVSLLEANDFSWYTHRQVPTNDGGLALGQAAIGIQKMLLL